MTLQEVKPRVQSSQSVIDLSASELAQKIRAGDLSAQEVVDAHIRRIEAVNPQLNAVVIPLFDEARAQAEEADQARSRGDDLGALHGVPVTIKEQFKVKGTQTTLGATNKVGNVYHSEGPLVTRLREAGAIILGKTNILQTLAGWESDNRVYGRTNNPWDLDRSPGGSSGGEAAIVAAGGSPLGLGADLGGSVRIPAHFCGVHSLKPTADRLSDDDFPADLLNNGQETLTEQPSPIARTVADIELAMGLFAETSLQTTTDLVPPVPWSDPATVKVEGMRIGIYTDNGYFPASPALRRAVKEAAEVLRRHGATVEPITPPDVAEGLRIFLGVITANGLEVYKQLLGDEKPVPQIAGLFQAVWSPSFIMPLVQWLYAARGQRHLVRAIEYLGARPLGDYWDLVKARTRYRSQFYQTLDEGDFDAVLCPPYALPAVTHGASEDLLPAATYAGVYNVLGTPAGVVSVSKVRPGEESDRETSKDMADITARNVEEGSAGLPVGVQVVARHWREDIVLKLMAVLEDHFQATPDYPVLPA